MTRLRRRHHDRPSPARKRSGLSLAALNVCLWLTVAPIFPGSHAADLQFDVFLGYGGQPNGLGGLIHEIGWTTVACEVHNPGQSFNALFEIGPANLGAGQTHRLALELPANTRKRLVIPLFMGGGYASWNARLVDGDGKIRAQLENLQPQSVAWDSLLVGALPRTVSGLPTLPPLVQDPARSSQQAVVSRLIPELMPDNPIGLEGLNAIYLNSDRASEVNTAQATALAQWLLHGGHLIVALEDAAALEGAAWLGAIVPFAPGQSRGIASAAAIVPWGVPLTNAVESASQPGGVSTGRASGFVRYSSATLFAPASPPVVQDISEIQLTPDNISAVAGDVTAGRVLLAADGLPLVIRAKHGRGVITVLTFSPEREPFRSWAHREWFWARLLQIPAEWFRPRSADSFDRVNADGLFGVLLDSRQVRSMPIAWLLLLLAVYLAVIGPIDRLVLKRMRREMLTWITFPAAVALFSLLIYYVGFRLRAGDIEWNELHLVDLLPAETTSSCRGRTYASLYSPVSARYPLSSSVPNSTLRGELFGYAQPGGEMAVTYHDRGFVGELAVAVWTSQLVVSDWLGSNQPPFTATLTGTPEDGRIRVQNHLNQPLKELRLAFQGRIHELGDLTAHDSMDLTLAELPVRALREFVFQNTSPLVSASQQRPFAFGSGNQGWPDPGPAITTALSFTAHSGSGSGPRPPQVAASPDFDCSSLVDRGDAVLLAWVPDYSPVPTARQFATTRFRQNTLFRLALPVEPAASSQP